MACPEHERREEIRHPFARHLPYLPASDFWNRTSPPSQVGGNNLDLLDSSKVKDHVKQVLGSLAALKVFNSYAQPLDFVLFAFGQ